MKYKKCVLLIFFSLALISIDQTIKTVVCKYLYNKDLSVIKGFLNLTYVENTGGAFGIGAKSTIIFIIFTIVLVAVLIGVLIKKRNEISNLKSISIILIISGGIGNLIDRIFRGYVIDYIDINELFTYPMFNFADICVVIGCIILAISIIFERGKDGE